MPRWLWSFLAMLALVGAAAAVTIVLATSAGTGGAAERPQGATAVPDTADNDHEAERIVDCDAAEPTAIPGTDIAVDPMSREQEAQVGESYRAEVLAYYPESSDDDTADDLDDLLDELAPEIDGIGFSVTLLDSAEVNAFALPGGALFFTTAIVDQMSVDELAFVMAHEIAHVECRHSAQQLEREALALAAIDAVLGDLVDTDAMYESTMGQGIAFLAGLSFSRDDEQEADLRALDLMDRAGRPTSAAADALRVLLNHTLEPASDVEVLLSTHPPTVKRIETVEDAA